MDTPIINTISGIGFVAIIARSSISGWLIREPVKQLRERITRTYKDGDTPEWCLYCTGFWCGIIFHFLGYGWSKDFWMSGLYLCGVMWLISEVLNLFESIWYYFVTPGE